MPGTPGTRKEANDPMAKLEYDETGRLLFTQEMRKEYTILIPQMLPVHFGFFAKLLERTGYHVAILNNDGRSVVDSWKRRGWTISPSSPSPLAWRRTPAFTGPWGSSAG